MRPAIFLTLAVLAVPFAFAGCSNNSGTGLTTSSVAKPAKARQVVDPACMTLTAKINAARQEGTPARVHAIAAGKTKVVRIKRSSLAKVAELDRLNSEYQVKCSKYPGVQSAAIAQPRTVHLAPAAKRTVATAKAVKKTTKVVSTTKPTIATPIVSVPKQ